MSAAPHESIWISLQCQTLQVMKHRPICSNYDLISRLAAPLKPRSHHRRRTPRTSPSIEPGCQPGASRWQRRRKSLTDETRRDEKVKAQKIRPLNQLMPQIRLECIRWCTFNTYHRKRWWPDDSSPEVVPTYSRCHDRPGRLPPKHTTQRQSINIRWGNTDKISRYNCTCSISQRSAWEIFEHSIPFFKKSIIFVLKWNCVREN